MIEKKKGTNYDMMMKREGRRRLGVHGKKSSFAIKRRKEMVRD